MEFVDTSIVSCVSYPESSMQAPQGFFCCVGGRLVRVGVWCGIFLFLSFAFFDSDKAIRATPVEHLVNAKTLSDQSLCLFAS